MTAETSFIVNFFLSFSLSFFFLQTNQVIDGEVIMLKDALGVGDMGGALNREINQCSQTSENRRNRPRDPDGGRLRNGDCC